jgi:acetyl-CoA acetyltransferase
VGATGVSQVYEIWLQLRGEADDRQVEGTKAGMTHNGGGMVRGQAAATTMHVLSV